MTEQEVVFFIARFLRSVLALEVLLLLRNGGSKEWEVAEFVHETWSSQMAVDDAIAVLQKAE